MRTMLKLTFPVETSNKAVKEGILTNTVMRFVEQMKPESAYFYPEAGKRAALFVFDLEDSTLIPTSVEPFFANLDATVELTPVMNLEDLKAGLAKM